MAHTVATMLGSGKAPDLKDFLPRWNPKRRRQTHEEQLRIFRALAERAAASETKG